MALSPAQKIRRSPRLGIGSCRKTGSSNSVGEASRKQLHEPPSTPLAKKKLSLPRNEIPNNLRVQVKSTLQSGNANASAATGGNEVKTEDKRSPFKATHGGKCSEGETLTSPKQPMKKEAVSHLNSDKDHDLSNHTSTTAKLSSPRGSSKPKNDHKTDENATSKGLGFDPNKDLQAGNKENMSAPRTVDSKKKVSASDGVQKRTKSPGVRVIGGRIYDSENGKTCHQCRQKTLEFMASCKNVVGKKSCTQNFCPKCLLNRYGEKVEEAVKSEEWKCPRCRNICNCSICMKKQGCAPTGMLVHAAKATGFASVADLLKCQGLSEEHVNSLNVSTINCLLESIRSGNVDVKDLVKKLKPVQSSMASEEATESCPLKEQNSPPPVSPSKAGKSKKSLVKSSTPSKVSKLQKPLDESSAPPRAVSQLKKAKNSSTSSKTISDKGLDPHRESVPVLKGGKNHKRINMVNMEANLNEGNLDCDIGKDGKRISDTHALNGKSIITKSNSKRKSNIKADTDLQKKGICEKGQLATNIVNDKETKSDTTESPCITKNANDNVKDKALTASKDTQYFLAIHESTEPLEMKKGAKIRLNLMPTESEHVLKVDVKQTKKRKSDKVDKPGKKDIMKGINDQSISVSDFQLEVADEKVNLKKKKCKDKNEMDEIILPQGQPMQLIEGIEFSSNDVGSALQFLEFCSAFEQVLDLKKGQPESILRELLRGRIGRRGLYSSVVQFHVKLLSLIGEDVGEQCEISHSVSDENSWLQVFKRLVMNKCHSIKEDHLSSSPSIPADEQQKLRQEIRQLDNFIDVSLKGKAEGYDALDPNIKLRLLNILCDECLSTGCLRNSIESANTRFIASKKDYKEEIMAAKEKAKEAQQKMKDEVARILLASKDGPSSTIDGHEQLISRVKLETEKAQAAKLDVLEAASRMKRQRCDAIRTVPIVRDKNGRAYWRLKGGSDRSVVLLQDTSSWENLAGQDVWYTYNEEDETILAKYISLSSRAEKACKRCRKQVSPDAYNNMAKSEPGSASEPSPEEAAAGVGEAVGV